MEIAADLVNPLLILCVLVAPRRLPPLRRRGFWLGAAAGVVFVYLFTFADRAFGWWSAAGMDFSTHTALAVSLATSLALLDRRWLWPLLPLLAGYAALMLRLGYHSLEDIGTAAAVAAPATWALHRLMNRPGPRAARS